VVLTTTASKNEIANLEEVLETVNVALPKSIPLKADKRYQSKKKCGITETTRIKESYSKKSIQE